MEEDMVPEQERLQARIEAEGNSLKQNLEEFEDRVKNVLDWKVWYRHNTALAIGGAAAGGILLALLLPKSDSGEEASPEIDDFDQVSAAETLSRIRPVRRSRFHNVLDNSMSAILGVAADQVQHFMSRAIPGFREHYSEAERKRGYSG
jgi:hypothetical protein